MIPFSQPRFGSDLLVRLRRLIIERTGICTTDDSSLAGAVEERSRALKIAEPCDYIRLLADDARGEGEEWRRLVLRITNGESYFFRDHGQMALLRETILPEIIERRRHERRLRIWSAGCSTGEEPYSLAILLAELLPDLYDWRITLLGTDINPDFLERARRGTFGQWSFRMVEPAIRARYFRERNGQWELNPEIRSLVTFDRLNILSDPMPMGWTGGLGFDLIVCRNVFIYFDRDAIQEVIAKFAGALDEQGVLMTGHSELAGIDLSTFITIRYPGSMIYRRVSRKERTAGAQPPPISARPSSPSVSSPPAPSRTGGFPVTLPDVQLPPILPPVNPSVPGPVPSAASGPAADPVAPFLKEAEGLLRGGAYAEVIGRGEPLIREVPDSAALRSIVAAAYANRGEYGRAEEQCRAALRISSFEVIPYHILAQIAEERGDRAEAKNLLRKVLYLAPSSVAAHLHLADIHDTEGDPARARTARAAALDILRSTDPATVIPMMEEFTVRELIDHLAGLLDAS